MFHKLLVYVNPRSAQSIFLTSVFVEKIPCVFLLMHPNIFEKKVVVGCRLGPEWRNYVIERGVMRICV